MAILINDFGIENAKSGRATCAGCHLKISKDEVRIKKTLHDTEVGMKFGGQAIWHHVECFAQLRSELGWFESAEKLPGFKSLSKDEQQAAKKHVPAIKQDIEEPSTKKPKMDKADAEIDSKIEKQNKEFYKLRDKLESQTKKPVHISILEAMKQAIPEGNSEVSQNSLIECKKNVLNTQQISICINRFLIMSLMSSILGRWNHAQNARMATSYLETICTFAKATFR